MQQIINFIIRNKNFLLFLFLFIVAMVFTIQSHSFHKSKFINSANFLTGGVYSSASIITGYFNLKHENKLLANENNRLKSIVYNIKKESNPIIHADTSSNNKSYKFYTANIIKNSYSSINNTLLINKGESSGIKQDFGVITSNGIVGIIDRVSNNYSTVISILSSSSSISAQLKSTNHLGSLTWNSKNPTFVQLVDIPKIAKVKIGDTIITSGRSSIFPKGIHIGTIDNFNLDKEENYYELNIKLFNDMTNIEHVSIIENLNIQEINNLLNTSNE